MILMMGVEWESMKDVFNLKYNVCSYFLFCAHNYAFILDAGHLITSYYP